MKLDFDIMRDLLIEIENELNLGDILYLSNSPITEDLDSQEKIYAAIKLHEAGYINASVSTFTDRTYRITITGLTYEGLKFLDNIRAKNSWEKAKKLAQNIGGVSVQILSDLACQISTELINKQLHN